VWSRPPCLKSKQAKPASEFTGSSSSSSSSSSLAGQTV